MGKELPLAREEEEGQAVLLARSRSGASKCKSSSRDKRKEEAGATKASKRRKAKGPSSKSKSSSKVKDTDASVPRAKGRGRDNKDRESDRGDEGENGKLRRTAQVLGIVYPGSHCDELLTKPHRWMEVDKIHGGSLFRCSKCKRHMWLPATLRDAERLSDLIWKYGGTEGYCRYLNRHRGAKVLMAKIQDLERLSRKKIGKAKFAKMVVEVMNDKEYDRV